LQSSVATSGLSNPTKRTLHGSNGCYDSIESTSAGSQDLVAAMQGVTEALLVLPDEFGRVSGEEV
jgi:hypothetical protein